MVLPILIIGIGIVALIVILGIVAIVFIFLNPYVVVAVAAIFAAVYYLKHRNTKRRK